MEKITKKMKISEILEKNPEAAGVMLSHGLGCVGCSAASGESLEEGGKAHGISGEQIDKIVEEINSASKKKD